ncbi:MAG: TraR/DksA family transcriptional regulator [Thermoanaerobaculia bacterium]|jgi:DnaK suppressor protein
MPTKTKVKANRWDAQRKKLLDKQRQMIDSYMRDRAAGNEQPEDGIQDLADKAANAYSKELNFSLSDADRDTLMHIEEALERLKENMYGSCANCTNDISEKRLEAVPWATMCIDCQELQEKGML